MTDWHVPVPNEPTGVAKKWLVITGIVSFLGGIAATVLVGIGAIAIFAATGSGPVLAMTVGSGGDINALPTKVGTCFNGNTNFTGGKIKSVTGEVECNADHTLEVYFSSAEVNGVADYYNDTDLSTFVDALCTLQFDQYVGVRYSDSSYSYVAAMPSKNAWASGDRQITCAVDTIDPATASARGSRA